jgi:pyruvate/2-oxoglutarate/acetoin dehydrogenase E1 component
MGQVLTYGSEISRAMDYLASHEKTIFLGQSVAYPGNVIYKTLEHLPPAKKLELPVFEDTQMGMSIGLAMQGYIPISVFPRFNFLLLAVNQLVNHLDKMQVLTKGQVRPKVIIKTMVGSTIPLHPGIQHCGDFTEAFRMLLNNVEVIKLEKSEQVFPAYQKALERQDGQSTLLIEMGDNP